MSKFGIPERAQPALVLRSPTGWGVWIKPRALWVAGANGRIDIYSKKGVFTFIDIAESYEPPNWVLNRLGKGVSQSFAPDLIGGMAGT